MCEERLNWSELSGNWSDWCEWIEVFVQFWCGFFERLWAVSRLTDVWRICFCCVWCNIIIIYLLCFSLSKAGERRFCGPPQDMMFQIYETAIRYKNLTSFQNDVVVLSFMRFKSSYMRKSSVLYHRFVLSQIWCCCVKPAPASSSILDFVYFILALWNVWMCDF